MALLRPVLRSLSESANAVGVVAILTLTVIPLVNDNGFQRPPPEIVLVPVIPVLAGLLSPDNVTQDKWWSIVNIVANVALWLPVGVGLRWRFGMPVRRVALMGLVASGTVEAGQAVSGQGRTSDVNDVLLNTVGAMLRAWLVGLAARAAASRGRGSPAD